MASEDIAFLPDGINGEPIVFRGLTSTELGTLAGLSVAVWLPLSLTLLLGARVLHDGVWARGASDCRHRVGGLVLDRRDEAR